MDGEDGNELEVDGVGAVGHRDCFLALWFGGLTILGSNEAINTQRRVHRPFQELILSRGMGSMPLRRSAVLILTLVSSCGVD